MKFQVEKKLILEKCTDFQGMQTMFIVIVCSVTFQWFVNISAENEIFVEKNEKEKKQFFIKTLEKYLN